MKNDPPKIASWLIRNNGLEKARGKALARLFEAHEHVDNYAVSIWREVKHHLATEPDRGGSHAA